MSEIEALLRKDEKILWKKSEHRNLLRCTSIFQICGFSCVTLIIILSIFFFPIIISDLRKIIFVLTAPLVFFISMSLRKYIKKQKRKMEMTNSELRKYNEAVIITNQRVFQRSYKNFNFEKDYYDKNQIQVVGHVIHFNLEQIQAIFFEFDKRARRFNELGIFLNFDFSFFESINFRKATPVCLFLKKEELLEIKAILDDLIQLGQKVVDLFGNQFYFSEDINIPEETINKLKFKFI